MAAKIKFPSTSEIAFYLCKHFSKIDDSERTILEENYSSIEVDRQLAQVGSKFYPEFTKGPYDLIAKLNTADPDEVFNQNNLRTVFIFRYNMEIGTDGIVSINSLSKRNRNEIYCKSRGGVTVKTWKTSKKIETHQVVLIAKENSIITCFPGTFAPSLPSANMTENEFKLAHDFWKQHVFIEYDE